MQPLGHARIAVDGPFNSTYKRMKFTNCLGLKVALAAMNANEFVVRQARAENTLPFSEVHCKRELAAWRRIRRFAGQVKMLSKRHKCPQKMFTIFPIGLSALSIAIALR